MSVHTVDSVAVETVPIPFPALARAAGRHAMRVGLVVVLLWIGGMKFTAYEAHAIEGLVANSPLMSWGYSLFNVRTFSAVLGVAEFVIGLLIAARPISSRAAALGSALAVGMFLTTLSFLLTTPGVWESSAGGFPALSVVPGQFLVKDFVLLSVSPWLFAEALTRSDAQPDQEGIKR